MSQPLRLVVFDMDGTLVDSQDMIVATMRKAFGGPGVQLPSREQVRSIVGLSLDRAFAELAPGLDPTARAEAVEKYRAGANALHAKGGDTAPLYPGARAALKALNAQDHTLLGVATGKARRGFDHICAAHDLDGFFVTWQTADQHLSMLEPALARLRMEVE